MTVCIDASLVLRLLLGEPGSDEAQKWFTRHAKEEFVAPHLFVAEVSSVLRGKCRQGRMAPEDTRQAMRFLTRLNVRLVWNWSLAERAFSLAEELDQPTVYDTLYLAVAEAEGCELWTADHRFVRSALPRYPFVRLLGS